MIEEREREKERIQDKVDSSSVSRKASCDYFCSASETAAIISLGSNTHTHTHLRKYLWQIAIKVQKTFLKESYFTCCAHKCCSFTTLDWNIPRFTAQIMWSYHSLLSQICLYLFVPVYRVSQSKLNGVAHERYRSGDWIESKPDS